MGISHLQNKYTRFNTKTSEEFNTASRSIKPGLIASGIVSAWTCKVLSVTALFGVMLTVVDRGRNLVGAIRSRSARETLLTSILGYKALPWHINMVWPDLFGKTSLVPYAGVRQLCRYRNAQCSWDQESFPLRDPNFSALFLDTSLIP